MFEFLYYTDYIKAAQNDDYYHFGFVDVPVPDWDWVLYTLDYAIKSSKIQSSKQELREQRNGGYIYNFPLDDPENFLAHRFLVEISKSVLLRKQGQHFSVFNFLSLSSISETLGRHNDVMDVWCWQIAGYTKMTVEGKFRLFEKVLEPGELIYIPRGMMHTTEPMGPRSLLSFGSEDFK